ncbi:PIN domain-containing protein [Noviherbaspirillum pedocola]|nr:hypothetical protein [Noviherbaspirillum pedocola]
MAESLCAVDTSAWIEWIIGSELANSFATDFPDESRCIVPTIVQLELAK